MRCKSEPALMTMTFEAELHCRMARMACPMLSHIGNEQESMRELDRRPASPVPD